jgi:hypothetical protein
VVILNNQKRLAQFKAVVEEAAVLFNEKNSQYNDSYFKEPEAKARWYGGLARKFARLENFYKNGYAEGEAVEETLLDALVYCCMELIFLREAEQDGE